MEQEFELRSFKLDVLGAECKYVLTETDDEGVTTEQEHNVKIARPVHNDLQLLSLHLKKYILH